MADLVTHILSAQWVALAKRQPRPQTAFVVGVMLPDLIANVPILILRAAEPLLPWPRPFWLPDALSSLHSPILYALLCSWLCAWLPATTRRRVFVALLSGGFLHIGVDLLQGHVVPGAYYPGFPLIRQPWTLGFLHTESSLLAMPFLLVATLVLMRLGSGQRSPRR